MLLIPILVTLFLFLKSIPITTAILFPQQSETRETLSLDGFWNFALSKEDGKESWYEDSLEKVAENVILMPVPSSYNDVVEDTDIRDHVGFVWYDRTFFVPSSWSEDRRVWLRFSSVSYSAKVWINGEVAMSHEIGHLPFENEVTFLLRFGENNRVTVAVDNKLTEYTIPQGTVTNVTTDNNTTKLLQTTYFEFFNYAGIDRPVTLYSTPTDYINDVTVETDIEGTTGVVNYTISFNATEEDDINVFVSLLDKNGYNVAEGLSANGNLQVPNAYFWWPYQMNSTPAYLYTLQVELRSSSNKTLDIYRLPVGIRSIGWTNSSLLFNGQPLYLYGFGRHEDSDIKGKGVDLPLIARDYSLIKWVGANAYRTSHYPYADEIMDMADKNGILIIDECPAATTQRFSDTLLENHKAALTQLYNRDKNRPSVIIWSISNEPTINTEAGGKYFGSVANHIKSFDKTRPITIALNGDYQTDYLGQHLDIISFNVYNAWYNRPGRLDTVAEYLLRDALGWREKYGKPVLLSEYGAESIPGIHDLPSSMFSEEYQVDLMSKHFKVFDYLREQEWFIGEFIWNFADFRTPLLEDSRTLMRADGCRKGIFSRNRQPKAAAYHLRRRYWNIAGELYNHSLPNDLFDYIFSKNSY